MAESKNIKDREIYCLHRKEATEKSNEMRIRVVQWIIDGEAKAVTLEKRDFYDSDGDLRMGKAKGFTVKDLELLAPKLAEVLEVMKNPPDLETEKAEPEAAQEPEPELY